MKTKLLTLFATVAIALGISGKAHAVADDPCHEECWTVSEGWTCNESGACWQPEEYQLCTEVCD
jgi:hypothetical protein